MKKMLLKIKEKLTGGESVKYDYHLGFPAIYATKEDLELAMQAAREQLASERAGYAGRVAIGSGDTNFKIERVDNFKKHKLDCDNCGGPLTVGNNNIASCSFCNSQYYLEGFKKDYSDDWEYEHDYIAEPYYVDGGVSMRSASKGAIAWL